MKKTIFLSILLFLCVGMHAQSTIQNFKVKNKSNQSERTEMLDLLRAKVKTEFKLDVQFVVNHFKVSGDYAWMRGDAKRIDGKSIQLPEDEPYDCCHVESFFQKQDGKWRIAESALFSTDVWWEGIQKRYPKANQSLFKED